MMFLAKSSVLDIRRMMKNIDHVYPRSRRPAQQQQLPDLAAAAAADRAVQLGDYGRHEG